MAQAMLLDEDVMKTLLEDLPEFEEDGCDIDLTTKAIEAFNAIAASVNNNQDQTVSYVESHDTVEKSAQQTGGLVDYEMSEEASNSSTSSTESEDEQPQKKTAPRKFKTTPNKDQHPIVLQRAFSGKSKEVRTSTYTSDVSHLNVYSDPQDKWARQGAHMSRKRTREPDYCKSKVEKIYYNNSGNKKMMGCNTFKRNSYIQHCFQKMRLEPNNVRFTKDCSMFLDGVTDNIFIRAPKTVQNNSVVFQSENLNDRYILKLAEMGMVNKSLECKIAPLELLQVNFHAIRAFATQSKNVAAYINLRKDTMACGTLQTLALFLEETMQYAQLCVENNIHLSDSADIILSTAPFLSHQIMFKLKNILCCVEKDRNCSAVCRQITYLICSCNRLVDAGALLQEVKIMSNLQLLIVCCLTVPSLYQAHLFDNLEILDYFKEILDFYKPGTISGICHSLYAKQPCSGPKSAECAGTLAATIGSNVSTQGLLFFPGP
ncbi:ORF57 [Felid gammaherpesvirus 1]|uniref:ORF57 n=1 Tax=Felid gammaherpesvirus 1 TaxID=2560468 RepID=A0A0M4M485_9GAMA|nr:ORF57 [Felis catus gammaherpesvirus 1]ALE14771.1 ORF57 [Felis catus gammaherpesvirus 1]